MNSWLYPMFSPVMKVVSAGCNLRCGYCFYFGSQLEVHVMDESTLRLAIDECLSVAPNVKFIWHGGEPTIPGVDYYRQVLEICEELRRPDQHISHSIQTNATLLDDEWAIFLRESGFGVGVSIDGPQPIHDIVRVDVLGRGTHNLVMRGIQYLREHQVKFGTVTVINNHSVTQPDEIFWFFYNHEIRFNANICTANPNDPSPIKALAISPMEYARFVLRLMELWLEVDDPHFRVGPVDDIIKGVLGRPMRLCRFKGQCHLYVTIDHNGDVYPCDGFLDHRYLLGNLTTMRLPSILAGDRAIVYFQSRDEVRAGCGNCEWLSICQGGCMRTWAAKSLAIPQDHSFCQARKLLFNEARAKLAQIGYVRI